MSTIVNKYKTEVSAKIHAYNTCTSYGILSKLELETTKICELVIKCNINCKAKCK